MQIYVHKNNEQLGPFTEAEIKAQLASGAITLQDHVWWQGQANWLPLGQTPLGGSSPMPAPSVPPVDSTQVGAVQSTSPLAIWSLVCGCLSIICGLFAAIPAIVLGHLALGDLKRNPGRPGRGLALAGLIIGYIMTILFIVILCFYAALMPTILKAVKEQQAQMMTVPPVPMTSPDQTPVPTNSDQSTNAPDQTTPATAPVNSPDQSTNSAPATPTVPDQSTNSPDTTTNASAASTNAPDTSTNAAPMSQ
jgi:uncharacterized membrane protein